MSTITTQQRKSASVTRQEPSSTAAHQLLGLSIGLTSTIGTPYPRQVATITVDSTLITVDSTLITSDAY
jgi:hypothetical protein